MPTPTQPPAFTSASFVYDGDGKQVKSIINGVTTIYVGAHYHVENGVVVKYYFAGANRIAVRKNGTLSYLLGDHLGSTSITTDASGNMLSNLKYKAWGETRYAYGSIPTNYKYTGQREEAGFGLYFYNARWYDPVSGRFTQADALMPIMYSGGTSAPLTVSYAQNLDLLKFYNSANSQSNGVVKTIQTPLLHQSFDRYNYVTNNPLKYEDDSGNCAGVLAYSDTLFCYSLLPTGPVGWIVVGVLTVGSLVIIFKVAVGASADADSQPISVSVSLSANTAGGGRQVAEHLAMLTGGDVAFFPGHPGFPDPEGRDRKHNAEGLRNSLNSLIKNIEKSGKSATEFLKSNGWTQQQIDDLFAQLQNYVDNVLSTDELWFKVDPKLADEIRYLTDLLLKLR